MGSPYVYAIYSFNHKLANKATQEPLVSNPESVTPHGPPPALASKTTNALTPNRPRRPKRKKNTDAR